jgi:hypothetical protein
MAQGGGQWWNRFFVHPTVALAQLDEVQAELMLNDEQQEQVVNLNRQLNEERMSLFQNAAGDRAKIREGIAKLNQEFADKFAEQLDESQRQRVREIYVQVNGLLVLQDKAIAESLDLTDEQLDKLEQARDAIRDEFMNAGLRDLGEEEAAKKVDELIKSRDEKLLAILTDQQRTQFEDMKGEKLEVDVTQMPGPGR